MGNKKLVGIIIGCVAVAVVIASIGCSPPAFRINVIPEQLRGSSIPGQYCVFLVTITHEEREGQLPVSISAQAPGAEVLIYQQDIIEGQVAEVVVIPGEANINKTIEVAITGNRDSQTDEKVVRFDVVEGDAGIQDYAGELFARFVPWLATNHPELGITDDTEWNGTIVSPE